MTAIPLGTFLRDRALYIAHPIDSSSTVELAVPHIHYESQDAYSTVSCCLAWRAEIRMSALDAHGCAPDIAVGAVDFLVLQLGYEPATDVLALYGHRASVFADLFDDKWLVDDLDESEQFTAGMPISVALLVLDADMDPHMPNTPVRAWAMAHIAHTVLPTTAGLLAMRAFAAPSSPSRPSRRLVSTDHVDPDWPRVGCIPIPGHPQFFGQATAYRFLDDARAALETTREQTYRVPVPWQSKYVIAQQMSSAFGARRAEQLSYDEEMGGALTISHQMRTLASLPWPATIGKDLEYPRLRRAVLRFLNPANGQPRSFQEAFSAEPSLRATIDAALTQAHWAVSLAEVDHAYALAEQSPLLGQRLLDPFAWRQWAGPLSDQYGSGMRFWLYHPITVAANGISDGRHRLTYLRLHRDPSYRVLVRVNHAR